MARRTAERRYIFPGPSKYSVQIQNKSVTITAPENWNTIQNNSDKTGEVAAQNIRPSDAPTQSTDIPVRPSTSAPSSPHADWQVRRDVRTHTALAALERAGAERHAASGQSLKFSLTMGDDGRSPSAPVTSEGRGSPRVPRGSSSRRRRTRGRCRGGERAGQGHAAAACLPPGNAAPRGLWVSNPRLRHVLEQLRHPSEKRRRQQEERGYQCKRPTGGASSSPSLAHLGCYSSRKDAFGTADRQRPSLGTGRWLSSCRLCLSRS